MNKINLMIIITLITLMSSMVMSSNIDNSNLIAYYGLDNTSDYTSNTYDLTTSGASSTSTGCINNNCYNFDGSNDYMYYTGNFLSGLSTATMCMWVKTDDTGSARQMYGGMQDTDGARFDFSLVYQDTSKDLAGYVEGNILQSSTDMGNTNIHFICLAHDTTNTTIYHDGSLVYTNSVYNSTLNSGTAFWLGADITSTSWYDGIIDEVSIWNVKLNSSDVSELWNSGTGKFYPFVSNITTNSSSIDLLFNTPTNTTYTTTFDEREDVNIWVNWTDDSDNSPLNDTVGNCSFILENAIEHEDYDVNFTLCGTACDYSSYEINVTHDSNISVRKDYIHVQICHEQLEQGNVLLTYECNGSSYNKNITAGEYALCSINSTDIWYNITECVDDIDVNLTISYDGTNNRAKRITLLGVDREYYNHTYPLGDDEVYYNDTLGLWGLNHPHYWLIKGNSLITATCNHSIDSNFDNTVQENIEIENIPPIIIFENIFLSNRTYSLVDNVVIEYEAGQWNWTGAVIDTDLWYFDVFWYDNSTNMIYNQTNLTITTQITTPDALFRDFEPEVEYYYIEVTAFDLYGENTTENRTFYVNDTVLPYCYLSDDTQTEGETYQFDVTCVDESLFSINVSCADGYSFYVDGLNDTSYTMNQQHAFNTTTVCTWYYCDGHTNEKLDKLWKTKMYQDDKGKDTLEFRIGWLDKNLLKCEDSCDFSVNYSWDRIEFDINFADKKGNYVLYYQTTGKGYHFQSEDYPAWIVDSGTQTWFDLKSSELKDYDIFYIGNNTWEIRIYGDTKNFKFKSIGELNCNTQNQTISVVPPTYFTVGSCPSTDRGMSALWLMCAIIGFFLLLSVIYKWKIIGMASSLGIMVLSWYVIGCLGLIGAILILIGAVLFFGFAFMQE